MMSYTLPARKSEKMPAMIRENRSPGILQSSRGLPSDDIALKIQFAFFPVGTDFFQHGADCCHHHGIDLSCGLRADTHAAHA